MSSKDRKTIAAAANSQHYKADSQFTYTGVDGRTYQAERELKPLEVRGKVIRNGKHNEKVNAVTLYNMERFLRGEKDYRYRSSQVPKAEIERIVSEYGMTLNEQENRYDADEEVVFTLLCEKWPEAAQYKKYKGILYAMKYGG